MSRYCHNIYCRPSIVCQGIVCQTIIKTMCSMSRLESRSRTRFMLMSKSRPWSLIHINYLLFPGVLIGHLVTSILLPPAQIRTHRVRLKSNQDSHSGSQIPIFAGVMTAGKYLNTRGCSSWRSWGADLGMHCSCFSTKLAYILCNFDNFLVKRGGEVRFFVGTSDTGFPPNACNLPIVVLPGVGDEEYPPQRKSFGMFRWMEQNYGNRLVNLFL